MDTQFVGVSHRTAELKHQYGKQVHLLARPLLWSRLARLCAPECTQPEMNLLIQELYTALLDTVVECEFPFKNAQQATRMHKEHAEAVYAGPILERATRAVCVNLARAGTLPSHICYDRLNHWLDPTGVRQDHISIARVTDATQTVQGSTVSGHKLGGSVEDAIVLIPDPMGATGGTVIQTLELYRNQGSPRKMIALHCIVTPEYLRKVTRAFPELVIYALRLDRGLSPAAVLKTELGSHWDQERGLNDHQYIVPGGGGFGEILNNAYV